MPFADDQGIDAGIDQREGEGVPSPSFHYYDLDAPVVDLDDCGPAVVVAGSDQDVFVRVRLTDAASGAAVDPTDQPLALAFTRGDDPGESDFADAGWLTRASDGGFYACGTTAGLSPGAWVAFVRAGGFIGRAGLLRVS